MGRSLNKALCLFSHQLISSLRGHCSNDVVLCLFQVVLGEFACIWISVYEPIHIIEWVAFWHRIVYYSLENAYGLIQETLIAKYLDVRALNNIFDFVVLTSDGHCSSIACV